MQNGNSLTRVGAVHPHPDLLLAPRRCRLTDRGDGGLGVVVVVGLGHGGRVGRQNGLGLDAVASRPAAEK